MGTSTSANKFHDHGNNNNEEVIHQLLNDNDYIRDAVRNHMEEFSKQQSLLIDKQERQKERLKKQREENKKKQQVTYPGMTCGLGGLFRGFMNTSTANVSGGQSVADSAYSSTYM